MLVEFEQLEDDDECRDEEVSSESPCEEELGKEEEGDAGIQSSNDNLI